MANDHPATNPTKVTIEKNDVWHVTVRESGYVIEVRNFVTERFAQNYADGQRIRLGLTPSKRFGDTTEAPPEPMVD